jgi:hypothetical protein
MKIKKIVMGLIVLSTLSWTSKNERQQNKTSDVIIKSWMLVDFDAREAEAKLPEKDRAQFKKVVAEMVAMAAVKTVYTFQKHGRIKTTTIAYDGGWKAGQGTWSISGNGKMLTIRIKDKVDKLEIARLTDKNLDLRSAEARMIMKFVPK